MRAPRAVLTFALAVALAVAFACTATAAMAKRPQLESDSAIVIDASTGEALLTQAAHVHRPIASTTKLMTARLALARTRPREVITAPPYDATPGESLIGLRAGERMTVHDLMRALLLESANDAANALAVGISGSVHAFVADMNAEARRLGLRETHYTNPIGLDEGPNYSSAYDLAKLARILMREPVFARIVDMRHARLKSGSHPRSIDNRNLLVDHYPFVDGVKTGHTRKAGYVLVGAATRRGAHVISVVLGEPSESARDSDSLSLLRWGLARFHRVTVMTPTRAVTTLPVRWRDQRAGVVPRATVQVTTRRGHRPRLRFELPSELEGPLPRGRRVGSAKVLVDGRVVRTVPLVTAEDVPGAGVARRLYSALGPAFATVAVLAALLAATLVALRVRAVRRRTRSPRSTTR